MTEETRRKAALVGAFERGAATYEQLGVDFFGPPGVELVHRAGVRSGQRVLDVGCGRGAVLVPAARAVGATGRVVGIDLAPTMVELTRAEVRAAGLSQVQVELGDAESPALPPGEFDVVLGGFVVFLLSDPAAALRGYRRLLCPDGRIGMTTFASQDPRFTEAMQMLVGYLPADRRRSPTSEHDALFATAESTAVLLRETGYRDVHVTDAAFESRFRDVEHWSAWIWSHGARSLLEQIPARRLPEALAEVTPVVERARAVAGDLVFTTTVRFAVAVSPG
ncbi:class I SAM-dependent methyltransferase [Micromonospora sp. WMMD1082]|uniref:class I SAM-dependent methyltransferase n=1 Tax=Micromonospora sp. WMMD1082 TaxID=3016104 RepID=UPI002415AAB1|nr:class I SAM-dependent methyltransferase [Micromonospora sp. WMMD1082]MDG4795577.1 methyltransferase domain-containing protein [Micromonospora sp. WMMD1082]